MQTKFSVFQDTWNHKLDGSLDSPNTLVIIFGPSKLDDVAKGLDDVIQAFPQSLIMGASSAGEILHDELIENSLVVSVVKFEDTNLTLTQHAITDTKDSFDGGMSIAEELFTPELKAIFVLSDGLNVNGSQFTKGINSVLPSNIPVTGGLAADDDRFEKTWVIVDGKPAQGYITALGLYGDRIQIKHGSKGGWDKLGVSREVTKSSANILYELDNQPALEIYKKYLGSQAEGLPGTGLLFPLSLEEKGSKNEAKVRTILAVNEQDQSITFAGDIPLGSSVTLMKANYDRLVDGAENAAKEMLLNDYKDENSLCIAISCVGRRLVLKQRIEEELEATLDVLPKNVKQVGFYSYGEISPLASGKCDLQNQTMTLTLLWESNASPT